jgi:hypothetical protein
MNIITTANDKKPKNHIPLLETFKMDDITVKLYLSFKEEIPGIIKPFKIKILSKNDNDINDLLKKFKCINVKKFNYKIVNYYINEKYGKQDEEVHLIGIESEHSYLKNDLNLSITLG